MVTKTLLGPSDLTRAQAFRIHKSIGVVVIDKDEDLIFAAF